MASLEPKVLLDKTQEDVEGADGFVYKGLPAAIRDGLEEMWAEETTNKRKKALRAWDAKVRLAIKLGQAAVPLPPICAELQRERMTSKPVAVASGGAGWGQADRPVGHRQEAVKQTGWAGVPGATVVQQKPKKEKKVPGAELEKKEKKEKPAGEERPQRHKEEAVDKQDFSSKSYADTSKSLRNASKKLKQIEKIRDDGAQDDAQKEKLKQLPVVRQEVQYLQGLVNRNVTSQ